MTSSWEQVDPKNSRSAVAELASRGWRHGGIDVWAIEARYQLDKRCLFADAEMPVESWESLYRELPQDPRGGKYAAHPMNSFAHMVYTPAGSTVRRSYCAQYPLLRGVWAGVMLNRDCILQGPVRMQNRKSDVESRYRLECITGGAENGDRPVEIVCNSEPGRSLKPFYTVVTILRRPADPPIVILHVPFGGEDARIVGDLLQSALFAGGSEALFAWSDNSQWRIMKANQIEDVMGRNGKTGFLNLPYFH